MRAVFPILAAAFLTWSARGVAAAEGPPKPAGKVPFYDLRQHQTEYAGPEREEPEPADVKEVLLGYFGPSDPKDPDGGDAWLAARMAIEQSNREGGYHGKPFRLVPGWADQPWKNGATLVTRMVYIDKVWALIGGPDGATTHLAEQIVAKAHLPLVSPGNTDRTANLANVPWMFSLLPGEHLQAPVLAEEIARTLHQQPLVVLAADDHDSKQFVFEMKRALAERRVQPRYEFVCGQTSESQTAVAAKAVQVAPGGILVSAAAEPSARLVKELRKAGFSGPVFGGPSFGRRRFVQEAGPAAEGSVFPLLIQQGSAAERFAEMFEKRHGRRPDYAVAATYDAVKMLVAAVRRAGLNRARIGDAVREMAPWAGACGTVVWDKLGSSSRGVALGSVKAGRN